MVVSIDRFRDELRVLPRALRAGVWVGSALPLLYGMTLLTEGRTDREWLSPPRAPEPTEAVQAPVAAVPEAAREALPEPADLLLAGAPKAEPQSGPEAPPDSAAKPASGAPRARLSARPHGRGLRTQRSRRVASRHAREPIEYRLADRPGI